MDEVVDHPVVSRLEGRKGNGDTRHAVPDERDREVHASHERTGIHPGIGPVGIACRRLTLIQRHPHVRERPCETQTLMACDDAIEGSDTADNEFKGCLELCAARGVREELRGSQYRLHDRAQVAVRNQEGLVPCV